MKWTFLFALGTILHPSVAVHDIDGVSREPLKVEKGRVEALFFVTNDCPISNYYSHEIRRICEDYAQRGVGCSLVYTDAALTDDQAREHALEYGHGSYPKIVLDGTYVSAGMPSFKQWLSADDVAAIRAFVIAQRNRIAK